jgi:hypothetical protein
MRRLLFRAVACCLISLGVLAPAGASEFEGKIGTVAPDKGEETCGSHGTRVEFVDTPSRAARIAKQEQKLVFVLHVSGNFEDPRFT